MTHRHLQTVGENSAESGLDLDKASHPKKSVFLHYMYIAAILHTDSEKNILHSRPNWALQLQGKSHGYFFIFFFLLVYRRMLKHVFKIKNYNSIYDECTQTHEHFTYYCCSETVANKRVMQQPCWLAAVAMVQRPMSICCGQINNFADTQFHLRTQQDTILATIIRYTGFFSCSVPTLYLLTTKRQQLIKADRNHKDHVLGDQGQRVLC